MGLCGDTESRHQEDWRTLGGWGGTCDSVMQNPGQQNIRQDLHLGEGGRIQVDSDQWSRPQLLWGPRMTEED